MSAAAGLDAGMMNATPTIGAGARSKKQHRGRRWSVVPVEMIEDMEHLNDQEILCHTLLDGFYLRFFSHNLKFLFTVCSTNVFCTRGVLDYLYEYNSQGPNKSKSKLFVCSMFDSTGECPNGHLCREVHCRLNMKSAINAKAFSVASNATGAPCLAAKIFCEDLIEEPPTQEEIEGKLLKHSLHTRWDPPSAHQCLPRNFVFKLSQPNTSVPIDEYPSERVFETKGTLEQCKQEQLNESSVILMQHCAHFTKNGVCCFGPDCQFVHVVRYNGILSQPRCDAQDCNGDDGNTNSESDEPMPSSKLPPSKHMESNGNHAHANGSSPARGGKGNKASNNASVHTAPTPTSAASVNAKRTSAEAPSQMPKQTELPPPAFQSLPQNQRQMSWAQAAPQVMMPWTAYANNTVSVGSMPIMPGCNDASHNANGLAFRNVPVSSSSSPSPMGPYNGANWITPSTAINGGNQHATYESLWAPQAQPQAQAQRQPSLFTNGNSAFSTKSDQPSLASTGRPATVTNGNESQIAEPAAPRNFNSFNTWLQSDAAAAQRNQFTSFTLPDLMSVVSSTLDSA